MWPSAEKATAIPLSPMPSVQRFSPEARSQPRSVPGIEIDRKKIMLAEPIRHLGEFTVAIKVHPEVTASLKVNGVQAWPLDSLQSLTFTFDLSTLEDASAKGVIQVGLRLTDDAAYMLDCMIVAGISEGQLQCKVQSPAQLEALADPVGLTLDDRHTIELVFDPQNYSVQAFLDGRYLGSRELQSVEFWRGRTVQPVLLARLENLQLGTFQCRWYGMTITQQPGAE